MSHRYAKGFTIVELLVVIAIIAVLVSMLLPTLSAARDQAALTVCMGQLHQNGQGLGAYQGDNKAFNPLFGGDMLLDGYGRTHGDGGTGGWEPYAFTNNANYLKFFPDYLNADASGTPGLKGRKITACPAVNWTVAGTWRFEYAVSASWYDAALVNSSRGITGYNYFTGRHLSGSTQGNFDTIARREDPKEILVVDQLAEGTQNGAGYSAAVPWFNPHIGRSCTTLRDGYANQLLANGVVERFRFADASRTIFNYSYFYASAKATGPGSSLTNGPYWISNK